MSKSITLDVGAGASVMGARVGMARYDEINDRVAADWYDPRVTRKCGDEQAVTPQGPPVDPRACSTSARDGAG